MESSTALAVIRAAVVVLMDAVGESQDDNGGLADGHYLAALNHLIQAERIVMCVDQRGAEHVGRPAEHSAGQPDGQTPIPGG